LAPPGANYTTERRFNARTTPIRAIYHSENGDRWLLSRDDDGRAFVLHKANPSSGGKVSSIELGDFLGADKAGPEHQALIRLIGSLVESG
jgi:hypothetical protein